MSNAIALKNYNIAIPSIGLGTFKAKGDEIKNAVRIAFNCGYRHFDTATVYRNETAIGEAFVDILKNCDRSHLFVTSKLSPSEQGYENATLAVNQSLKNLQLDYLDLYLIHWPGVSKMKGEDRRNLELRLESWRALEDLHLEGKIKAIGVSNFEISHLSNLIENSKLLPAVNQVEYHPLCTQKPLREFCESHDIVLEAYSSLGTGELLYDPNIKKIAEEVGKTPAQILLRFGIQQEIPVIPKSINADRIKENFEVFDFSLTDSQMERLHTLNKNRHYCWHSTHVI